MLSPPESAAEPTTDTVVPPPPSPGGGRPARWVAAAAVVWAALMALHAWIPNSVGNAGSLFQTLLPWTGLSVPVLLVLAAVCRSRLAAVAVLAPAVVWVTLFGGALTDKRADARSGTGDLTVVSHNVDEGNTDPVGTARVLAAADADVLALEELSAASAPTYTRELAAAYPHHAVLGGVGLWSKHPLEEVKAVPIMPWTRAVRATARTPEGPVAVYAVHLASVRVSAAGFTTGRRNEAARALAAALREERAPRLVVLGDFNGTFRDAALAPVTSRLRSAQREAGDGFGFTWPAAFPVVRIDDVLVRGMTPRSAWTLPATGSDHLPVAATLGR
ncbi:endonuclease/exonuclease/phosphatase family protein [Streptomyces sp. C11-1]|uniref:Endonuclease/exonuclease/phosphatase family protein n=1 Tax=Streptomyces durocortorensis TaxID=2811104 RepID=A0ABY9VWP0_9ACTN|nr:endonuclease/exonuclease/phosphatase family protein [Streptomyces durocortorensis]WNF28043.1 endonuclease/exonuclease/phosphatase family protein [Streptomyces durocortorensis]